MAWPVLTVCFEQRGDSTSLGSVLTAADAAYLSCSSHLTTHEEGEALAIAAVDPEAASFFFFCGVSVPFCSQPLMGRDVFEMLQAG